MSVQCDGDSIACHVIRCKEHHSRALLRVELSSFCVNNNSLQNTTENPSYSLVRMAIINSWLPPSREHWEMLNWAWQFFPLVSRMKPNTEESSLICCSQLAVGQAFTSYYPSGKTSVVSRFNIPGKIGWFTMEIPSIIIMLYNMVYLPQQLGISKLPLPNKLMAGLFVSTNRPIDLDLR